MVDTNVWSELVKAVANPAVRKWEAENAAQLWLSTIVMGEFLAGVALMAAGNRKTALLATYGQILDVHHDRIIDYDVAAARHYAEVIALLTQAGRNPKTAHAQIAATALANEMKVATRNVKDFEGLGLEMINPWGG